MKYVGTVIRPPSEAYSIILQVTIGCSHNRCTFCGAYKDVRFSIKEDSALQDDLSFAARHYRSSNKVFLADGDALILPYEKLVSLLQKIHEKLPWVNRVSTYANARAIRSKSPEQLRELRKLGLHRIYLGLESGHDEVLYRVKKGETASSMIEACQKIKESGLYLSVTVLLGLGEKLLSEDHAQQTARVLNEIAPNQTAALSLMPLPNTPLGALYAQGQFILPSPLELLGELKILIEKMTCSTQFYANHASNHLPLTGRLPRDSQKLLTMIDKAINGSIQLVPESMRGL